MRPNFVRACTGSSFLLSILLLSHCQRTAGTLAAPDAETLSPSVQEDIEYIGLGSVWSTVLRSDRTFSMSKSEDLGEPSVLEIRGSYEAFNSGFYKLRTELAEGSQRDKALEESFAFSVPGAFLITKAFDDDGSVAKETQLQPARTRSCPGREIKYNWMRTQATSVHNLETAKRWGNATLPKEGGEIKGYRWKLDGTMTKKPQSMFIASRCEQGMWKTKRDQSSGETNYGFFMSTQSGIGLMDPKVNDDDEDTHLRTIALPVDEDVTESSLSGKTFIGILFRNINQGVMYAIEVTFDENGIGKFSYLDDVENGKLGPEQGLLSVVRAGTGEQQGFLQLESSGDFEGTGSLWAMVSTNLNQTRRTFFYATGILDPNLKRGVSIIAVQK